MHFENTMAGVSSARLANAVFEELLVAKSASIFTEDQLNGLFSRMEKTITEGNVSGSIPFDLDDQINQFPVLNNPVHRQIIVERSIKKLQVSSSDRRQIKGLIEYVQRVGVGSEEGKRIESLLPTMNIKRSEIDLVGSVFPSSAVALKEGLSTRVFLQIKGGDRILMEDLLQTFRTQLRGVEWVAAPGANIMTLTIERVRQDERILPERSQTITYATHEVNIVSPVLLMPRNASYLYELISGGAEIEYGYVITAVVDRKTVHDEIVRGKVGGNYQRCQNERIQNVFGGVSPAGFVANDDMRQRCSGPSSSSIDELRGQVFLKLVEGVLKVPSIKAVHELN